MLGVRAEHGRLFTPDEDRDGVQPSVVVLSHAIWRQRFGGDPAAVGRVIRLDGRAFTIVGVVPETATFPAADLWIPLAASARSDRTDKWLDVIGRLAPNASLAGGASRRRTGCGRRRGRTCERDRLVGARGAAAGLARRAGTAPHGLGAARRGRRAARAGVREHRRPADDARRVAAHRDGRAHGDGRGAGAARPAARHRKPAARRDRRRRRTAAGVLDPRRAVDSAGAICCRSDESRGWTAVRLR